jgi:CRISPR-associated RAMP protein (TIGR02581 family)
MSASSPAWLALSNRYLIEGELIAEGSLHVGSGFTGEVEGADTDSALLRDHRGLLIPGSSLRGAMRSMAERILQTLDRRGCVLFVKGSHKTCLSAKEDEEQREKEALPEEELVHYLLGKQNGLCDICKLFGSPWLASKLRVSDCRPLGDTHTRIRHGVGIDRDTRTARDQIKYDFEVLEPGPPDGEDALRLCFAIEVHNANEQDLAILGILLKQMQKQGIVAGGKRSRGLGLMKLKLGKVVRYFDEAPESPYKLKDFLLEGNLGELPAGQFGAMLDTAILNYLSEVESAAASAE